ncbi:hypothetical protein GCM10010282_14280 [Streptomyces roseolus]|nr:hypothetical protein GCM10010282_14280 [Streptomyces roseolus]
MGEQEALVYELLELDVLRSERLVEQLGVEDAHRDLFLGCKVKIQRTLGHSGAREDLPDGGPLVSALREDGGGCFEDRPSCSDGTRLLRHRALPLSHCVLSPCDVKH